MKYIYTAAFLNAGDVLKALDKINNKRLQNIVKNFHVTFCYNPKYVNENLFGEKIIVKFIGYGNNLKNEGFLVELRSENNEINELVESIEVPHITTSVAENEKAVNTKNLNFEKIEPFELTAFYGAFCDNGDIVITKSF